MADIPGNSSTTATVTVGSTTNGSLETIGDHDWFMPSWQSIAVIAWITLVPMCIGNVCWFAIGGLSSWGRYREPGGGRDVPS